MERLTTPRLTCPSSLAHSYFWSLRRFVDDKPGKPIATIEVDPKRRRIVQLRGFKNRWVVTLRSCC